MASESQSQPYVIWPPQSTSQQVSALPSRGSQWWDLFKESLDPSDLRRSEHVHTSALDIVARLPDPVSWGADPSPYKGLVVGAVQSGKTENMIGVSAVALDQGYKGIIVLTGNNDDLRAQTALRFNTTLLQQADRKVGNAGGYTIPNRHGPGPGPLGGYAPRYNLDTTGNPSLGSEIDKYLRLEEPFVIVVKKNTSTLEALGAAIRSANLNRYSDPIALLVIDDECDEGSVGKRGPDNPVPDAIEQLWRNGPASLKIAYVGYTATAAANLLQDVDNPLYPSEFMFLLKYPYESGSELTWEQPYADSWYSGGDLFYRRFGLETGVNFNFLVRNEMTDREANSPNDNQSLYEAVVAYFVSGAYRLAIQGDRRFGDGTMAPDAHCMLIQASQSIRDHLAWRDAIQDMFGGGQGEDKSVLFDPVVLLDRLLAEEDHWKTWFHDFERSRNRVRLELRGIAQTSDFVTWDDVKDKLLDVFTNVRLKIVNSDDEVGTGLDFAPSWSNNGFLPAQDCYVIIVGGQKLSRGITIPGLCITYYSRESQSHKPYADATLQLSRWFGYRGKHIEFCRLFVTENTHSTLLDIHENDQDYRFRLSQIGREHQTLDEARIALLESPSYRITAKTGNETRRRSLKFSPHSILYTRVETRGQSAYNQEWALAVISQIKSTPYRLVYSRDGDELGILSPGWSASKVADILDGIRLTGHNPDNGLFPTPELYKQTDTDRPVNRLLDLEEDPYVVAAYLRFWARSDRFDTPSFNIAIPYGLLTNSNPFDYPLLDKAISGPSDRLRESWQDQLYVRGAIAYFDSPPRNQVSNLGLRDRDCEGLLALYVIHKDSVGLGSGIRRETHTPTLGISIPAGGPSFQVVSNYEVNA